MNVLAGMGFTSMLRGEVVGAYRSITFPSLSTRNFEKFHLILSPNRPPLLDFKNLYKGAALLPFTSTFKT
jgi:hypothetical protein